MAHQVDELAVHQVHMTSPLPSCLKHHWRKQHGLDVRALHPLSDPPCSRKAIIGCLDMQEGPGWQVCDMLILIMTSPLSVCARGKACCQCCARSALWPSEAVLPYPSYLAAQVDNQ